MGKILVIDDETDIRKVVNALLTQSGFDVIEADYGLNGYSKALDEQPNLILLDLIMPVVDGFEVLSKLKQNPITRGIPVIILTAKIDAASERKCMRLGAVDYIKKPWGPGEIEDRVRMALGFPEPDPTATLNDSISLIDDGLDTSTSEVPPAASEAGTTREFKTQQILAPRFQQDNKYLACEAWRCQGLSQLPVFHRC